MATRNKPKKADFVYNGKRYWFPRCDAIDISDSEDTQAFFLSWTTLDYDTDEEVDETFMRDETFSDKEEAALNRVFPCMEKELNWYEGY